MPSSDVDESSPSQQPRRRLRIIEDDASSRCVSWALYATRASIILLLLYVGQMQGATLQAAADNVLHNAKDTVRGSVISQTYMYSGDSDLTPLEVLTRSSDASTMTCPNGMVPVQDTIVPRNVSHPAGRKIPRIVHFTSKSRCVLPKVRDSLDRWRFPNHAFYFHDDDAVMALLNESWVDDAFRTGRWPNESSPCTWEHAYPPNIPARDVAIKCATAGATKADLWRYAVLWRYGGIYSDVDNTPNKFNGETIRDDDDSFMILEQLGIIAQYFLTSSPGHPYMKYTMDDALDHLRQTPNVMVNVPEKNTGPGAVKRGFCFFMEAGGNRTTGYIEAGWFVGAQNRSVRVVGHKGRAKEYVDRYGIGALKGEYYKSSNITHFGGMRRKYPNKPGMPSCEDHVQRTKGDPGRQVANYRYSESQQKYFEALT